MNNFTVKAIVEVEKGSKKRAVFDKDFKVLKYRKAGTSYPFAYGSILDTSSEDGDGIDCYILTNKQLKAGSVVECTPIGLLEVFENDETDCKIINVIEGDDFNFDHVHLEQIKRFILELFKKYPKIKISFGEFKDGGYSIDYIKDRIKN